MINPRQKLLVSRGLVQPVSWENRRGSARVMPMTLNLGCGFDSRPSGSFMNKSTIGR